ncbi:MAG TPA: SiaC family regulatory phosphoprotein [Anaeromyxobacteraceae bacterium]|nr:SiaC family regulatory phosphoprotein [Anaeromyxobacteraceae bacterium]
MDHFTLGDLSANLDREGARELRIRMEGKSASREAGKVLAPLFDQALAVAKSEGRSLALHFEALEYFNSSTIAALVQFIRSVQEGGVDMEVVYDARHKWQAMSFDALRRALRPFEAGGGPGVRFRSIE